MATTSACGASTIPATWTEADAGRSRRRVFRRSRQACALDRGCLARAPVCRAARCPGAGRRPRDRAARARCGSKSSGSRSCRRSSARPRRVAMTNCRRWRRSAGSFSLSPISRSHMSRQAAASPAAAGADAPVQGSLRARAHQDLGDGAVARAAIERPQRVDDAAGPFIDADVAGTDGGQAPCHFLEEVRRGPPGQCLPWT